MDTGAYMANQMDDQIERGLIQAEFFYKWLDEIYDLKFKGQDLFYAMSTIDMADAKLSFLDGISAEEYSKKI